MAKIYDKTTDSTDFGTDKSLILESKDAYHVPFTFGDDWTHIRLGVLMSVVTSADDNLGSANDLDIGGFDDPTTTTWFGVNKNGNPLRLPKETGSGGFIGYKADRIFGDNGSSSNNGYGSSEAASNWTSSAYQRFIATSGNAEVVATQVSDGTTTLTPADADEGGLITAHEADKVVNPSYYCAANVIEIKIIGKGTSSEKIQIRNNIRGSYAGQEYGDIDTLKNIMDQQGDYTDNMLWYEADLGSNRWADYSNYYPDSFLFYNSAPSSGSIRPRIHCWAVKKLA